MGRNGPADNQAIDRLMAEELKAFRRFQILLHAREKIAKPLGYGGVPRVHCLDPSCKIAQLRWSIGAGSEIELVTT